MHTPNLPDTKALVLARNRLNADTMAILTPLNATNSSDPAIASTLATATYLYDATSNGTWVEPQAVLDANLQAHEILDNQALDAALADLPALSGMEDATIMP